MEKLFLDLYKEYINYLNSTGLIDNGCLTVNFDKTPYIDFQLLLQRHFINDLEALRTNLSSYLLFFKKLSEINGTTLEEAEKANFYEIFGFKFSEIYNYITPPINTYQIINKRNISELKINSDIFNSAMKGGHNYELKKKHLIIFENLRIEKDFIIDENIKFIRLSQEQIKSQIQNRFEPDIKWSKVNTAIEINSEEFNEEIIFKLSTLLRIFKKGDIRYKCTYKEAIHYFKGLIYVNYKSTFSEEEYKEHPSTKDAPIIYIINNSEIESFREFLKSSLPNLEHLTYSCRVYNMIHSTNPQLRIPVIFFIIESFFSDIDSEVVFRVSLYVTNILKEDDSFFGALKKFYAIRSKIAHGDVKGSKKIIKKLIDAGFIASGSPSNVNDKLIEILDKLFKELIKLKWNPDKSSEEMKPYLLKHNT
jgi:hypothetical protein